MRKPRPPVSNVAYDESEAPTLKRNRPAELGETRAPTHVTTLRKIELRRTQQPVSGLRAALTVEEVERYELREKRETLPAPPDVTEAERKG